MQLRSRAVLLTAALLVSACEHAAAARRHPDYSRLAELARMEGHAKTITGAAFSPNGSVVATASYDGTVRVWNASTGKLIRTIAENITYKRRKRRARGEPIVEEDVLMNFSSITFSPDGRTIAVGCSDESVRLWDATTGGLLRTLEGHDWNVDSVQFRRDGRKLLVAGRHVYIWDLDAGRIERSINIMVKVKSGNNPPTDWPGWPKGAFYSPDERLIATVIGRVCRASSSGILRKPLCKLEGHKGYHTSIAWSPDGRLLVTGSRDKTAIIWDARSGRPLRVLVGHSGTVNCVAFSPYGRVVATAGQDNTARIWDIAGGRVLRVISDLPRGVDLVAFSPDGRKLLTASGDNVVRIWGERK